MPFKQSNSLRSFALTLTYLMSGSILVWPVQAVAHHSAAAYDESKTIAITGEVTALQWRNPHVILIMDVKGADGKTVSWPLETTGIQQLTRNGWNRDIVAPGTKLSAGLHPMLTNNPGGILLWVTLENGQRLNVRTTPLPPSTTSGDTPAAPERPALVVPEETTHVNPVSVTAEDQSLSLSERAAKSRADFERRRKEWNALEAEIRPDVLPLVETDQPSALLSARTSRDLGDVPFDFTGVWMHRADREQSARRGGMPWHFLPVPPLTQSARESKDSVVARRKAGDPTADPAALCYPHGLPRAMARAGNMMILQEKNAIFTIHRLNNDYRAIFLDGRDHVPADVRIQSYNGDSIGYWEKDDLYIESVGFGEKFHYINEGIPIGKNGKIEERWYLVNDNNTLIVEFRMTDPDNWKGEWVDFKIWDRNIGGDIREANCILAEDGVLAGLGGAKTDAKKPDDQTAQSETPSNQGLNQGMSSSSKLLILIFGMGLGFGVFLVLTLLRRLSKRSSN